MRYGRVIGLLTGLLAFCWALEASADWIGWKSAFSGYSAFAQGSTDGYVSFAVGEGTYPYPYPWDDSLFSPWCWERVDGNTYDFVPKSWSELTGRYIYFYQVVNAQDGGVGLSSFQIAANRGAFLQMGYLKKTEGNAEYGVVFNEAAGEVGSSSNPTLGDLKDVIDDAPDGKPTLSGATPTTPNGLVVDGNDVTTVFPTLMSFGSAGQYVQWTFASGNENYINNGQTSTILFLTSNHPPGYRPSYVQDGGNPADCDVPATPEPGTLIGLATLALAGGGLRLVRRRKA